MTRRLPLVLWLASVACIGAGVALIAAYPDSAYEGWGFRGLTGPIGLSFISVGALVASRQPRNAVAWLLCATGLTASASMPVGEWMLSLSAPRTPLPGALALAWVNSWIWIPCVVAPVWLVLVLLPDGRPPSPRWRPVVAVMWAAIPIAWLDQAFLAPNINNTSIDNPYVVRGALATVLRVVSTPATVVVLGGWVIGLTALAVRFRLSRGLERQQLKWIALYGIIAALAFGTLFADQAVPSGDRFEKAAQTAQIVTFALFPVSVGIAILRYKLYEVDRLISRTAGYSVLTLLLAGVYASLVVVLGPLARLVTESSQNVAVAASTLAVAAMFGPLRSRVQNGIDRRFNRSRYDAATTIADFGARLRDQIEIDGLRSEICRVAADTMRPAHVTLWVGSRDGSRPP